MLLFMQGIRVNILFPLSTEMSDLQLLARGDDGSIQVIGLAEVRADLARACAQWGQRSSSIEHLQDTCETPSFPVIRAVMETQGAVGISLTKSM